MAITRRQMMQSLASGVGAPLLERSERRNERKRHKDEIIVHGTIEVPEEVIRLALQGEFARTTHRHVVVRLKRRGVVWLFRELAASTHYLGEVVRTEAGPHRVHIFRALPPGTEPRWSIVETTDDPPTAEVQVWPWEDVHVHAD